MLIIFANKTWLQQPLSQVFSQYNYLPRSHNLNPSESWCYIFILKYQYLLGKLTNYFKIQFTFLCCYSLVIFNIYSKGESVHILRQYMVQYSIDKLHFNEM